LAYVKGSASYGICLGSNNNNTLVAFCYADYAGDPNIRRSTTGYVVMLNGGPVTWGSRQQQCVSLSTTEAEYVEACETTRKVAWLRNLFQDIGIVQKTATVSIITRCFRNLS
jgi:hypothetical protein